MQDAEERRRLLDRYGGERFDPLVAVLKCAAGLLALLGIAAAPWLLLGRDGGKVAESPASQMTKTIPSSMAESRRIFEERRRLHAERARANTLAQDGWVAGAEAAGGPAGK